MKNLMHSSSLLLGVVCSLTMGLQGCSNQSYSQLPATTAKSSLTANPESYRYLIGPGDVLSIFVWRNDEITTTVKVRPDGMINAPLVEDIKVSEKTPTQVAREIETALAKYIRDPIVSVKMDNFIGPYTEQVRVIGEAAQPKSLAYNEDMTLLDVIIAVGGLTEFADGNNAVLARVVNGKQKRFSLRMEDLLQGGDMNANVDILPGDIVIIPEAWF